ncbi:MAG: cytochrome c maturation protein CcmE [Gammaproteobacteria bacterium]|jgi:cytochrome c-type biogenesis protein CcmE|nr:cytochrome c maturation protein CcmE [Gammaproteobacteria bacterium]MBT4244757.1 cytochrome c maturation protein CcmE [Gammaproteobacteria bacterium]MBT4586413.1 cytochrome c maturation protein CcmE [Gammaproteobacteria bacterium]MBT4974783.1 cytochrome c maturation protein CcmE [Gammaproteobacteria bacterium]MBT5408101.1 cytochrome c maturation protein CcmE [Gammaproteobacteria bacterium]
MTRRQNRMLLVALLLFGVFSAGYLGIKAFNENLLYFYTPTDVANGKAPIGKSFRVGGLVEKDSVQRRDMMVSFVVTDNNKSIEVNYEGILPDLFREGQGVVTSGSLTSKCVKNWFGKGCKYIFLATDVLAKHDENYMPPEVAAALEATAGKE